MRSTHHPHDQPSYTAETTPQDSTEPGQPTWTARPMSRTARTVLHVVAGFVALALSQIIAVQLYILPVSVELFAAIDLPGGFIFVVAVLEALAMMLVIFPRTRFYGAALTALVMLGALILFASVEAYAIWPMLGAGVLLACSLVLAWFYRPTSREQLFGRRARYAREDRLRRMHRHDADSTARP